MPRTLKEAGFPSLSCSSKLIELRQSGQYLRISPQVKGLNAVFHTARHVRVHDAERGAAIVPTREDLVWPVEYRGQAMLQCFAGLKPLIRDFLESRGLQVETTGKEFSSLPEPDPDQLVSFKREDWALLDFVFRRDRGMILVERQGKVSVSRLIAQIALAWPKKRIVIVASGIDDARRLARQLRKLLPKVGLVTSKDKTQQPKRRVLVVTPHYIRRGDVAAEKCHVCIALNPTELFGEALDGGHKVAGALKRARLYGVLDADEQVSPRLRGWVAALFGMNSVLIPRHGHQPVQVRVAFSPVRGGIRPPNHKDEALVKRLGVHEHHLRNRRICNLAQALVLNARQWLKADYPNVAASLGERVGRVGVLVDHVPHGLALAGKLGWPFVVGPLFNGDGLSGEEAELIDLGTDERLRTTRPVVVTGRSLKRAGKFDVLIRADGGVGLPAIPLAKLSAPDDDIQKMLLIDFKDEHHPLLRRWSRQRRTAYGEAGWDVVGQESSELARFLATRPKGVV